MAQARPPEMRRRVAFLLALGAGLVFTALSRGQLVYGDDVLLFQVTEAITARGELAVTSPFEEGDVARAIRGRDGRGYSKYGIGLSLVALPAHAAGGLLTPRRRLLTECSRAPARGSH